MSDGPEWFAPKRFGYGPGLPISWQGWALTILYVGLVLAATRLLPRHGLAFASAVASLTVLFVFIGAMTTRGGARWRWGEKDSD